MSKHLLGLALAGAIALASTSAFAVDVRNDDDQSREVIVSIWKDGNPNITIDNIIELAPGEIARDVCTGCFLAVGGEEEADIVKAKNDQLVAIMKGAIFHKY